MHLLRRETNGDFSIADYDDRQLPPYAILSHTWGSDNDEVSFKDIMKGRGKEKQGYAKLHFCANQADNDGLEYFWVDTCCIDKKDSVELSKAINSMFSWYQQSARCYVYLSDVAAPPRSPWKTAFQKSKWFTRGWTLQELLAPSSVEFFTVDGERLGNKQTLSQAIRHATAISSRALETSPLRLSDFSIAERMSWAAGRETKREEDAIYSILGLFDIHMPPIYGEGKINAFDRLESEIERKLVLDSSRKRSASDAFETTLSGPEGSNSKLKQSASDRAQEHSVAMKDWWAEAIARNMGTPTGYANVAVLLLKWSDELDELRTGDEVEELERVFRERFHFKTDVVELNHRSKPQHQMDRVLTTFVETYDHPGNLLIVFYTGHSAHYKNAGRLEFLPSLESSTARGTSSGGQINWYKTEDYLCSDEIDGDVLAILDTEYASNGNIRRVSNDESSSNYRDQGTARCFQLINSCDLMPPGPESFTRILIDGLKELHEHNGDSAFSTQDLHQCVEMRRPGTSSKMWSLLPNKRHILLTPTVQSGAGTRVPQQHRRRPGRGYLKLGLEIRDASLEQEQVDYLVRVLLSSLDKPLIGLRGIDWLGFERREKELISFSENLSLKLRVFETWKRLVARRKEDMAGAIQ